MENQFPLSEQFDSCAKVQEKKEQKKLCIIYWQVKGEKISTWETKSQTQNLTNPSLY